jgi:hypothetical protein
MVGHKSFTSPAFNSGTGSQGCLCSSPRPRSFMPQRLDRIEDGSVHCGVGCRFILDIGAHVHPKQTIVNGLFFGVKKSGGAIPIAPPPAFFSALRLNFCGKTAKSVAKSLPIRVAANRAMMAITTRNSMRVKAASRSLFVAFSYAVTVI